MRKSLAPAAYEMNDDIRWARHQSAASHMARALANVYLTRTEKPDDPVRVSYVEITRVIFNPKRRSAVLHVRLHWRRIDEGILRKTILLEHWSYKRDTWVLDKVEQNGGPEFPWLANLTPPRARPSRTGTARPAPRTRP